MHLIKHRRHSVYNIRATQHHRYRHPNYAIISLCLTLLLSLFLCGQRRVQAARDVGIVAIGLRPVAETNRVSSLSYFILNGIPGTVVHDEVTVINSGTLPGDVTLKSVDATTGQTSGVVYYGADVRTQEVGSWITLKSRDITLAAGASTVVPFTVTVPQRVRPGQHVGGIIALATPLGASSQQTSVQKSSLHIQTRNVTVVAVQINVPGRLIEQLQAKAIQPGEIAQYQVLYITLQNVGMDMLKPYGSLQVTDAQGTMVQNDALKLDTFLPQTSINYPVYVQHAALSVGTYRATLTLSYGQQQTLRYVTDFSITKQSSQSIYSSLKQNPASPLSVENISLWLPVSILILAGILFCFFQVRVARRIPRKK